MTIMTKAERFQLTLDLIQKKPLNKFEIAELTDTSLKNVDCVVLALRKSRLIHISGYAPHEKTLHVTPVYAVGHQQDAPRPASKWARLLEQRRERVEQQSSRSKFKCHRDWAVAAFFGEQTVVERRA